MGGGSKSQTIGFRYYMSLHMGLCRGPIDELVQIKVGDLRAWPIPEKRRVAIAEGPDGTGIVQLAGGGYEVTTADQINTARSNGSVQISASQLFGGDSKEGGVAGSLQVMRGALDQIVPAWIKSLMGGNVPAFRGVTTLFFDGLLTSMNPYPKKWTFRVRRTVSGWDGPVWQPDLATIWMMNGRIKAMNPAHIIYECLTNRDWGRGMSRDMILESEWLKSAQKLSDEIFGLCLRYNRQSELSGFIQEVLDHIGGSIYPDRATGKLALSLIRADYDPNDLPLFTYDTGLIELEAEDTASQEDLINEVILKWEDPIMSRDRAARVQNIAHRQSTGAVNSTTLSYTGIPSVHLALRVAQRNLKAGATALKKYKVVLDRRAWRIVPGKAFRISVPEEGIYNAVLRAGKVSEGGYQDGRITVDAVLDVFGLPDSSFIDPEEPEWIPPDRSAQVAENRIVREATYVEAFLSLDAANLNILPDDAGTVATLVGRPSSLSQAYNLELLAEGETVPTAGAGSFAPFVVLSAAMGEYDTVLAYDFSSDPGLMTVGAMVQIGSEICRLDAIDAENALLTIGRGCVDTLPRKHAIGTIAYIFTDSEVGGDGREYANGEEVSVKVLPYTSTEKLDPALADNDLITIRARQGRPYPPANLLIGGIPFANVTTATGDISMAWAHRDRKVQQDRLVAHQEASVGPETGTTYRVRVYRGDTTDPVRTVGGITGTEFVYTAAMAAEDAILSEVWFELESVRDNRASHQRYRFGLLVN